MAFSKLKGFVLVPSVQVPVVGGMLLGSSLFFVTISRSIMGLLVANHQDFSSLGVQFEELGFSLPYQMQAMILVPAIVFTMVSVLTMYGALKFTQQIAVPLDRWHQDWSHWVAHSEMKRLDVPTSDVPGFQKLYQLIQFVFAPQLFNALESQNFLTEIKLQPHDCFQAFKKRFYITLGFFSLANIAFLGFYYRFFFGLFSSIYDKLQAASVDAGLLRLYSSEQAAIEQHFVFLTLIFMGGSLVLTLFLGARVLRGPSLFYRLMLRLILRESPERELAQIKNLKIGIFRNKLGVQLLEILHRHKHQTLTYPLSREMQEARRLQMNSQRFKAILKKE